MKKVFIAVLAAVLCSASMVGFAFEAAPQKNDTFTTDIAASEKYQVCEKRVNSDDQSSEGIDAEEKYELFRSFWLPDEQYKELLTSYVPDGVAILEEYIDELVKDESSADLHRIFNNYYTEHQILPSDKYTDRECLAIIESLAQIYKDYPGLTKEQYVDLLEIRRTETRSATHTPYQEAVIAGKVDENARKLTYEDLKEIINKYPDPDDLDKVKEAIREIQEIPDLICGSGFTFMYYYPSENEAICLSYSGTVSITYQKNGQAEFLAKYVQE